MSANTADEQLIALVNNGYKVLATIKAADYAAEEEGLWDGTYAESAKTINTLTRPPPTLWASRSAVGYSASIFFSD